MEAAGTEWPSYTIDENCILTIHADDSVVEDFWLCIIDGYGQISILHISAWSSPAPWSACNHRITPLEDGQEIDLREFEGVDCDGVPTETMSWSTLKAIYR